MGKGRYNHNPVVIDGIKFDSTVEGKRYRCLKQLQEDGIISDLKCHVPFELVPKMKLSKPRHNPTKKNWEYVEQKVTYEADFVYTDNEGNQVVEDVKGAVLTPEYKLKRKLMKYKYNIEISEVFLR